MPDFTDKLQPSKPDGPTILAKERAQSNISAEELAQHLLSHDGFLERQARILPILEKEPLFNKKQQANLSRPDLFKLALARAKLLRRLVDRHGWNIDDYKMAETLIDDVSPYFLHMHMFVTTVREQASDAQKAHWMPLIESFKIIGAYAQTELGHGSNVQGLELEARWDQRTHEFILHSPTLTASKWWNGSLGRTANHAIVVAQLLLPRPGTETSASPQYVSHGPHPFIVQVRHMESHQPLDGIVIGDIGPKFGYSTIDNAYMLFDQFRVPHSALLSRYSQVDPETGAYSQPKMGKVVYGTMTYVRSLIVHQSRLALARAVTVAVRYTSIRRQFKDRDNAKGPEIHVLDYPTVQIRILPLLATTYALHYVGLAMQKTYKSARMEIERGDFSSLAYMHSMSSGLKSHCTNIVADGIETCRRALGGHGYGGASGFTRLGPDYLSRVTVEGDNWMITQQVASYLIKRMTDAAANIHTPAVDAIDASYKEFLTAHQNGQVIEPYDVFNSDYAIVKSFQRRASALLYDVYVERVINKKPWTSLMIQLNKVSQAQSLVIMVEVFYEALKSEKAISEAAKASLWDLYRLFSFYTMESSSYDFFNSGAVSQRQLSELPTKVKQFMTQIRPHAVNLVDAWMIPDYLLDSALGRYDGKVYEDLFNRAHHENPLNQITFNPNYWENEIVKGGGDEWSSILAKL
ncbi:acyl-CoA dehydrogenase/oxidase C-terminal [Talaromyces proteolyticus]|uniref:Acyl-coenzyme A oxidase n=1 Tax=Talaromyces proteolyticus TaxID=1131652 RepID=A0AAD4KR87_9EURO|nr:acyl-CoA dehydrogenase/oxidase C-terminal [Talaromyces proteolyticus]KAH8697520.1 acyl-CoA dehydrogenase/oxidase C-terminal [Talaromyces proteolyticus]